MSKPKKIKLAGRTWKVVYSNKNMKKWGLWGYANHTHRVLQISTKHKSRRALVGTAIHETLHILFPKLKEKIIKSYERQILKVIDATRALKD